MNFLFVIAATVSLILIPLTFFLFLSTERYRKRAKQLEVQLATTTAQTNALQKEAGEIKELRTQNSHYLEQKSIAITEQQGLEKKLEAAQTERNVYLSQKDEAMAARMEAEKKLELIQQKMQEVEKRMLDWEMQRTESLKAAKASILEAGGQLSSKLLEDHKREAEAAKKETESLVKKTTEALFEQVTKVSESVATLRDQSGKTEQKMDTVWKALTSPSGSGALAEVGLENTLKNLGLEPMRDYRIQYSFTGTDGGTKRPDAVIFLPQDMIMVVDSKASKFLIEIEGADSQGTREEALANLARTMNEHLKSLASKDYQAGILESYKEAGRGNKISKIFSIMYLPTESALEHIKRADPEFTYKAQKYNIMLASPAGLFGLFSIAKQEIGAARQEENQMLIVQQVQELMDNLVTVLSYAEGVGKNLKNAVGSFNKFAGSINNRTLGKLQKLVSLGVSPKKALPSRIPNFEVRLTEELLIEGEAEAIEDYGLIESIPREKISA
jgi:DNA recombination protein RmuC